MKTLPTAITADTTMREASAADQHYLAECFVNISRFIKSQASNVYIDGLPDAVDQRTLELAKSYLNTPDAITFIVEKDQQPVACIAGRIESTSFGPSGVGEIGNIAICWVAESYRAQHIGKALVNQIESWFVDRGINTVELSYFAQNAVAEKAWGKIGYTPFRVFSYKTLSKH